MNELTTSKSTLPAQQEAQAILRAAEEDAGFEKLLKFKKGQYECDNEEVKLGTEYVAHCEGWTKAWIKFVEGQVVDRKIFPVAESRRPPDREELDDLQLRGTKDPKSGLSADPWVYQHLLPLEDKAGDLVVFVTSSTGGRRAVADLCKSYGRRLARTGVSDNPVIKISSVDMPTKHFGNVPRPNFEIVGWDSGRAEIRQVTAPDTLRQEMDDEIPF